VKEEKKVEKDEKVTAPAAPEKPILSKIGEKFNQLELMKIIKGDFAAIENLGPRLKEIAREVVGTN